MLERFFRNKNKGTIDLLARQAQQVSVFQQQIQQDRAVSHYPRLSGMATLRLSQELTGFLRDHFMAGTKCDGQHKRLSKGARLDHPDDLQWRN